MRRVLCAIGVLSAAVAMAAPAVGADLLVVPRLPSASWTGFYTGVSIGGRATRADWITQAFNQPGGSVAPPFSDIDASFGTAAARIGGYLGYNYQLGNAVIGVEGDFGKAFRSEKVIVGIPGAGIGFAILAATNPSSTSVDLQWDASLRLRAGILAAPNVLFYGTGGVAFQHVEATVFCSALIPVAQGCGFAGSPDVTSSVGKTLVGWTVGGGIEAAFWGNWLARADYRYADFGTFDHTFPLGPNAFGDPVTSTRIATHTFALGLAYKFGAPAATEGLPVIAMPVKALPVKAPVAAPSWTGFHAGLALGARRTGADWITTTLPFGIPPFADNMASFDSIAFRVGGYAGYDIQAGRAVVGVEGSVGQASNSKRTIVGVPGLGGTPGPDTDSTSVKTGWDGSVVARFGYLIAPDALIYGTTGVAFQRVTIAAICGSTISGECLFDASETVARTLSGGTLGVGVEALLAGHWLARLDYRYASLGTFAHIFFPADPISSATTGTRFTTHTATFGMAYKFN